MNLYMVGTAVEIAAAFEDLNGDFADPSFVRATLITPSGDSVDLTGTVQRRGVGDYFLLYVPIESGLHQYRLAGYGDVVAANEGQFYAETSFPYAAIIFTPAGELDFGEVQQAILQSFSVFLTVPAGEVDVSSDPPFTGNFVVAPNTGNIAAVGRSGTGLVIVGSQPSPQNMFMVGAAPVFDIIALTDRATPSFTSVAPVLKTNYQIIPVVGGIDMAGNVPSLNGKLIISPNSAVFSINGQVPPLLTNDQTGTGSIAFSGAVPVITRGFTLVGTAGAGVLTGNAPADSFGLNWPTLAGSLVLAGAAPALGISSPRNINAGAMNLTGVAPGIQYTSSIPVPAGALNLTGNLVLPNVSFMPLAGSLVLAGVASSLIRGSVAGPAAGVLAFTGVAPSLKFAFTIAPPVGSLVATGNAATVTVVSGVTVDAHFEDGNGSSPATPFAFTASAGADPGTVGAHANRVLIVGGGHTPTSTIGALTWQGTATTVIVTATSPAGNKTADLHGLIAPATGDGSLSVAFSGTPNTVAIGALSLYGADQATGWRNGITATGTSSAPSITVNSTPGSMIVVAMADDNSTGAFVPTAPAAIVWAERRFDGNYHLIKCPASAGATTTVTGTLTESVGWAMAAVEVFPS